MTEETIKDLPLDTLFDLMIQTFREFLDEEKSHQNVIVARDKKKDIGAHTKSYHCESSKTLPG